MPEYRIALLPGDGVGHELIAAAETVLQALEVPAEYLRGQAGLGSWTNQGTAFSRSTLEMMKSSRCALLGPMASVTTRSPASGENNGSYHDPLELLRKVFRLDNDIRWYGEELVVWRPNPYGADSQKIFSSLASGFRKAIEEHYEQMAVFAEDRLEDIVISLAITNRRNCEKLVHQVFRYALAYDYPLLTIINLGKDINGYLLEEQARKIGRSYPAITIREVNSLEMFRRISPATSQRQIVLETDGEMMLLAEMADNQSQLCSCCRADIGMAYAAFMPAHGPLFCYADQNNVNPIAMLRATQKMLEYLGEMTRAQKLRQAIQAVSGEIKTPGMKMQGRTTRALVQTIAAKL